MQSATFYLFLICCLQTAVSFALADDKSAMAAISPCVSCHGKDGNSIDAKGPKLASQYKDYILKQLEDYQNGRRSGHPFDISKVASEDASLIADYYSSQRLKNTKNKKTVSVTPGETIYREGRAESDVKQCGNCHGENGMGRGKNISMFPIVAGQNRNYLVAQLKEYRAGTRLNDISGLMTYASKNLSDNDIELLADYLSSLDGDNGPEIAIATTTQTTAPAKSLPVVNKPAPTEAQPARADNQTTPSVPSEKQQEAARLAAIEKEKQKEEASLAAIEKKKLATIEKEKRKEDARLAAIEKEKQREQARLAAEKRPPTGTGLVNDATYRKNKISNGKRKAIACEVCHGRGGHSTKANYPSLAGRDRGHIVKQLKDYKDGVKRGAIMEEVARSLSIIDMEEIAEYFANEK